MWEVQIFKKKNSPLNSILYDKRICAMLQANYQKINSNIKKQKKETLKKQYDCSNIVC